MIQDTLVEVRRFLSVVSEGSAPNELTLILALDRLVMSYHAAPDCDAAEEDSEPPEFDWTALYQRMATRFPDYGMYIVADPLGGIDESPMVGDAIDDLADIIRDMREVVWRSENLGDDDAHWYLRLMFFHWGKHARELSLYLHARQF